jgi:L-lactate dehydrogenase
LIPPPQERITAEVVTAAERIIRGKGATNYAVGLAATRVIEAILRDENSVQPVSSLLDGGYGIDDVSLPSNVNRGGVATTLDVPCSAPPADSWRRGPRSSDTRRWQAGLPIACRGSG